MLTSGCLALMAAGMVACFSGGVQGDIKMTCSDAFIQGLPTCKELMAKTLPGVATTSTGTYVTTMVPGQR